MTTLGLYLFAALAEISGCFAFWAWLRLDRSPFWAAAGVVVLVLFAFTLTRSEVAFAGRAFAAYGGIYIGASLVWLWLVEDTVPDRWDLAGVSLSIIGAAVIVLGHRTG
ncbi:MAG: YnfA family protein [Proteobacteria bacterium]|nr:YnfA family protein [Pseudomonadota bacterium]MBI3499202.1 YnfA family protein [Pseudomonadota bacterium]